MGSVFSLPDEGDELDADAAVNNLLGKLKKDIRHWNQWLQKAKTTKQSFPLSEWIDMMEDTEKLMRACRKQLEILSPAEKRKTSVPMLAQHDGKDLHQIVGELDKDFTMWAEVFVEMDRTNTYYPHMLWDMLWQSGHKLRNYIASQTQTKEQSKPPRPTTASPNRTDQPSRDRQGQNPPDRPPRDKHHGSKGAVSDQYLQAENYRLQNQLNQYEAQIKRLDDGKMNNRRELQVLRSENEDLTLRLSRLAGEQLTRDNPDIADLSDRNRPDKLGEMYSELYDNEWTDAFEDLFNAGYTEREAADTLRLTLQDTYDFCKTKSGLLLTRTAGAVKLLFQEPVRKYKASMMLPKQASPMEQPKDDFDSSAMNFQLQRKWKPKRTTPASPMKAQSYANPIVHVNVDEHIIKLKKDVSYSMMPIVQNAYINKQWDSDCVRSMKPFIARCLHICWMIVVQAPPMVLLKPPERGAHFETKYYRQYIKSGKRFDFLIWPTLLLYENGPVVAKGIAEAIAD